MKGVNKRADRPERIRFDPLALLLDAALEGDMDLAKSSAKLVSANDYSHKRNANEAERIAFCSL